VIIRVLVVDDQALARTGFSMILDAERDIDIVGEAQDGEQAIREVKRTRPDVVLMDVRMPKMDGIEATARIVADRAAQLVPRVLILTTFDLDEYVFRGLRAGASGFLLKDVSPEDLVQAVRVVAEGEALLSPSVTRRLIEEFARTPGLPSSPPRELAALTEREGEVLRLIGRGLSNREIADRLVLSMATIKTHVNRLFTKLSLRDRTQAVILAYEWGIVHAGEAHADPDARGSDRPSTSPG
jgi:DNA-binding NarL/FixJ family response regulator